MLQGLARTLDFIIDVPGAYFGEPSASAMLDKLASIYERDPDAVVGAFRQLGVTPSTTDAPR